MNLHLLPLLSPTPRSGSCSGHPEPHHDHLRRGSRRSIASTRSAECTSRPVGLVIVAYIFYVILAHALPCNHIPYQTVIWLNLYHALTYHTTMPYHAMSYHTVLYQTAPYHIMHHSMLCHVKPCHFSVPYHALYHAISYHVIPCRAMLLGCTMR